MEDRYIKVRCDKCNYCREIVYMDNSYNPELPDYIKRLSDSICNHLTRMLDTQEIELNKRQKE